MKPFRRKWHAVELRFSTIENDCGVLKDGHEAVTSECEGLHQEIDDLRAWAQESHRWHEKWGLRWKIYMLVVTLLVPLTFGWTVERLRAQDEQTCHSRQEFRGEIIDVVRLALQDVPSERPVVVRLNDATKPGGPLGPIEC
jgi:hypothetical protein